MARKGKKEYVTFKSVRLPIYPYIHNGKECYRFIYPDESVKGGWRYGTRSSRKLAREAAHAKAVEIVNGHLDLSNISRAQSKLCQEFLSLNPTHDDLRRLREWKNAHQMPLTDSIDKFKGELPQPLSRHHSSLIKTLRNLSEFTENPSIGAIQKEDLTDFLHSRDVGPTRKNELRANMVQFFNWAKREVLIDAPNGLTIADRIPRARMQKQQAIRYLSSEEMKILLENVHHNYLPWLVLCGFAPIRSEELHARNYGDKPPLDWSAIKMDQGIIDLPAINSKVKKRRIIPINDTLKAWLIYISPPKTGRIVPGPPTAYETKRLGEILDQKFERKEGWPKNALRHTFLTFSSAIRKDLPAIAFEAGTSVQKLNSNYVEATTEKQAKDFFALNPSDILRTDK